MHYLSIGAIFRMENSWLDEWIQYHHSLGVEYFYLVCHDSDTRVPDRILRPYIEKGMVNLQYVKDMGGVDHSPSAWVQCEVYKKVIHYATEKTQWLALIDLDEFLLPRQSDDLRVFLQDYEKESSLVVNWNIFGTNGYIKRPETQINHLFHRAETYWQRNRFIKSIVRPERVICKEISDVHYFPVLSGYSVDENYRPIRTMWNDITTEKIRINHYVLRSWQDFWEVKSQRSRSTHSSKCDLQYFEEHDRNEVFDDEISRRFGHFIDNQS